MDNETKKMFEILISKIDTISESQKNMGKRLNSMGERLNSMGERLNSMDERLNSMDESLNSMDERQKSMEMRQDEIFSVVKAIEHSNTEHKAEIDNIMYKVAHTEGTINKIGNVIIESRAVKQMEQIR